MDTLIKVLVYLTILTFLMAVFVLYFSQRSEETYYPKTSISKTMELSSPAFANNSNIPQKYTCDGDDVNPPLQINKVPEGTKSLVLIVDDPDAPLGTWDHWLVWNISPSVSLIEEDSIPGGAIEGTNDFGKQPYGGPCPPSGTHHYHFKLYALDKTLNMPASARKEELEKAMEEHVLDWTELVGLYQR